MQVQLNGVGQTCGMVLRLLSVWAMFLWFLRLAWLSVWPQCAMVVHNLRICRGEGTAAVVGVTWRLVGSLWVEADVLALCGAKVAFVVQEQWLVVLHHLYFCGVKTGEFGCGHGRAAWWLP